MQCTCSHCPTHVGPELHGLIPWKFSHLSSEFSKLLAPHSLTTGCQDFYPFLWSAPRTLFLSRTCISRMLQCFEKGGVVGYLVHKNTGVSRFENICGGLLLVSFSFNIFSWFFYSKEIPRSQNKCRTKCHFWVESHVSG